MKNYDDKLFVGNIMQRTLFENRVVGPLTVEAAPVCRVIKKNAILYKTKNGGFVDIDKLNLDGLFAPLKIKNIDQIEIETSSKKNKDGLTIMPAIFLDDVRKPTKENGCDGVLGDFVDAYSLISYTKFKNSHTDNTEKTKSFNK